MICRTEPAVMRSKTGGTATLCAITVLPNRIV
jgi:hypothetical protein